MYSSSPKSVETFLSNKMADEIDAPPKRVKKKGLPPISPRPTSNENDVKPVKRKPKKKAQPDAAATSDAPAAAEDKPTPRRRRKRTPSQTRESDAEKVGTEATTAPRKKKKKPKASTEDSNQNADGTEPKQSPKESQGSKTSLISKEGGTPRKKGVKKKKKVKKTSPSEDEFGDSPWAADLKTMTEDIISGTERLEEEEEDEEEKESPRKTKTPRALVSAPVLRSQPLDKIFIETSTRFKGQSKNALTKQMAEQTQVEVLPVEITRATTIDFAIMTHKVFRVITLFLHGLVAGLGLWQMVTVFTLTTTFSSTDFLEHYHKVAMPLQGSLYFLLALCTVSVCDRFDISNPTRRFVLRAFTMQNGAISIIFYLIAVIMNLVAIRYEDRMNLYKEYADLYANDSLKDEDISVFKKINAARSAFIILGWLILSITPKADRLGKNLHSGETGLERELEMDRVSSA